MSNPRTCRTNTAGQHLQIGEHLASCVHPDLCAGCRPCERDPQTGRAHGHCTSCDRHTDPDRTVCLTCVSRARRDLRTLGKLSQLAAQVTVDRLTAPTVSLRGPAGQYDAWLEHQVNTRLSLHVAGLPVPEWEATDFQHPDVVVGYWSALARDEHGIATHGNQPWAHVLTALDPISQTPDWSNLAQDLHGAVLYAEQLLGLDTRRQRGVDCPVCGRARLELHHREKRNARGRHVLTGETRPDGTPLIEADDRWTCPSCHEQWTTNEYASIVDGTWLANTDRMCAHDLQTIHRIKPGTLISWASKGLVTRRGRDSSGRQMYDVVEALTQRDRRAQA